MTIDDLSVGLRASRVSVVSSDAIENFAQITGDRNPVHLDGEYARNTRFGERIAHGVMVAGYISAVLGNDLPGPGTIYLGQTLKFVKPVRIGDVITAYVQITAIDRERRRITLETKCTNQANDCVLSGEATVYFPEK